MEDYKKEANAEFFKKIIEVTVEGGVYVYPATNQTYTIVGGIMYGTKEGVKIIKDITPKAFHNMVKEGLEA